MTVLQVLRVKRVFREKLELKELEGLMVIRVTKEILVPKEKKAREVFRVKGGFMVKPVSTEPLV